MESLQGTKAVGGAFSQKHPLWPSINSSFPLLLLPRLDCFLLCSLNPSPPPPSAVHGKGPATLSQALGLGHREARTTRGSLGLLKGAGLTMIGRQGAGWRGMSPPVPGLPGQVHGALHSLEPPVISQCFFSIQAGVGKTAAFLESTVWVY